jgi:hypothetical protein
MTLDGAHPVDVQTLVERVLFAQVTGSMKLVITRPPMDEAGHIEIKVEKIGQPWEPSSSDHELAWFTKAMKKVEGTDGSD